MHTITPQTVGAPTVWGVISVRASAPTWMTKQHLTQHKDRLVALPPYPYTITTAIKDRLVALPPCPTLPASVFINHPEGRLQPHRGSLAAHTFIGNNKGVGVRVDSQYYHEWWAFSHCMYISWPGHHINLWQNWWEWVYLHHCMMERNWK